MKKIKKQIIAETLKFVDTITELRDKMTELVTKKTWCPICQRETEQQLFFEDQNGDFPPAIKIQCLTCGRELDLKTKVVMEPTKI